MADDTTPSRRGSLNIRWLLVALWAALSILAGPLFSSALDPTRSTFRSTVSIGLWIGWVAVLGATLVPRPITLTAVRIAAPASLAAAVWAALVADADSWAIVAGLASTAAVTLVSLSPAVADAFVNGAAYGPERRMPLRPPGLLLLGPIPLGWLAVVVGALAGPLLLADQQWVVGLVALVVGWPVAAIAARSLDLLTQRCVVFVPNGFVLIDRLTLADSFLMQRRLVTSVGPAPKDSMARDLTAGALGLAVQVTLSEPDIIVVNPPRRSPRDHPPPTTPEVDAVLFSPSRPGAFLAEAARRKLPIG